MTCKLLNPTNNRIDTIDKAMNKPPFFSVIVPTYNQAQYLGDALDTLLAQTAPDFEAIVVNDGSTDSTPEILEAYVRKDRRFRVIHKDNGGVASALNAGLKQARGEWICWLSSDDLFDKHKLAIHLEWIDRYPDCRFFFTRDRYLHGSTNRIENPRDTIPFGRKWGIVELLRNPYIGGNSICVHRSLWDRVGNFNERLRYAQDYDMWLRMMVHHPPMLIPERTCITRIHPLQATAGFQGATRFEGATVAINFLNQHTFSDLVPLVDLNDSRMASKAITKALDVAADLSACLYSLGPNPALLFRIMEWVWNCDSPEIKSFAKEIIRKRAIDVWSRSPGADFELLWKAIAVASKFTQLGFTYQPISPNRVAEIYYRSLKSRSDNKAEQLSRYMTMFQDQPVPKHVPARQGKLKRVVIVFKEGTYLTDPRKDGSFRAMLLLARKLTEAGDTVLLTSLSSQSIGFVDGLLFVGAHDEKSLAWAVASLSPVDMLIAMSRSNVSQMAYSHRYLNLSDKADDAPSLERLLNILSSSDDPRLALDFIESVSAKASNIHMICWFLCRRDRITRILLWMLAKVRFLIRSRILRNRERFRIVLSRIDGEPLTKWPSLLKGLWNERQQKRHST
jgi:glycosyltransferase involved in cell wall biosynthesis